MYKILIAITLSIFFTGCASKSVSLNTDSECEPKWNDMKKTFFWEKSYVTNIKKGKIYGRGNERAFDRNTARRASESLARADILRQLKETFSNDFNRLYSENQQRLGVSQNATTTKEFKDNILSSVVGSCSMCFIIKFEDCFEDGMWSAYALAELDYDNQTNTEMKKLLENSFPELKKQKEKQKEKEFEF